MLNPTLAVHAQARQPSEAAVSIELRAGGSPPLLTLPDSDPTLDASVDFSPLEHSLGSISPPTSSGNTGSGGPQGLAPDSPEGGPPFGGNTPTSRWAPAGHHAQCMVPEYRSALSAGLPSVEIVPLGAAGAAGGGGGNPVGREAGRASQGGRRQGRLARRLAGWACWSAASSAIGSVELVGGLRARVESGRMLGCR